jgi:hypothetical protein
MVCSKENLYRAYRREETEKALEYINDPEAKNTSHRVSHFLCEEKIFICY